MKLSRGSRIAVCAALLATAVMSAAALAAAGKPDVVVGISAMKEVVTRDPQGQEKVALAPAEASGQGDTLVYEIAYTNKGDVPALNARVVDPIPSGTTLVAESWSADNADMTVSVDGGKTFSTYPVQQSVTLPDGSKSTKNVEPASYTYLAWTAKEPLAPGATRKARFKVVVR